MYNYHLTRAIYYIERHPFVVIALTLAVTVSLAIGFGGDA